jgi:hypothetical protein
MAEHDNTICSALPAADVPKGVTGPGIALVSTGLYF